jgi:hypothetical protein
LPAARSIHPAIFRSARLTLRSAPRRVRSVPGNVRSAPGSARSGGLIFFSDPTSVRSGGPNLIFVPGTPSLEERIEGAVAPPTFLAREKGPFRQEMLEGSAGGPGHPGRRTS